MELLEFIKSAEDKLGLILTFPQDPHHIRLYREDREGDSHASGVSTFPVYVQRCDGAWKRKQFKDKYETAGLT